MAQRTCLAAALTYANRGWRVFPLNGKKPFPGTHGHREATTNRKQIRQWWAQWPAANVGIACDSQTGPIVVDIDGPLGARLYDAMNLPISRTASSRNAKRRHVYFNPPLDGSRIKRMLKVRPELDILGDGGYVVAPPSVHPDTKRRYKWLRRGVLAPFPTELLELAASRSKKTAAAPLPEIIGEGQRDDLLTSLAGSMRRRGASEDAILAALREENQTRCDPPLRDSELRKIAHSIARKAPVGNTEHLTDLGNARRFIVQHGDDLRSVAIQRRPWFLWEGRRWIPDDTGAVDRFAKDTVRALYQEAVHAIDEETRESILKHATRSEQSSRIRGMLDLAATEPEISTTAIRFDADPWLFNVDNGTLNLKNGKFVPHTRTHLITRLAPVQFNAQACAPRWEQFLLEIMHGDAELVDFLQRAVGYSMTGETREQCLFFLYGQGSNGKSTFLEVLRELFGGYAQQADFTTFLSRNSEGPRNDLARMRGARLVTAAEASGDKGFDETVLKQLTGGDTIVARRLYEEHFEFKPEHKLFLAANHKPMVREQTEAFWRRIRLIPFTVTFPAGKRDKLLPVKLRKELPGILNWAVEGCQRWAADGLHVPRAVTKATRTYRDENDLLGEFIGQKCALDPEGWASSSALYRVFEDWWLETRGSRTKPFSMSWMTRAFTERPEVHATKRGGIRGWRGVNVREDLTRI